MANLTKAVFALKQNQTDPWLNAYNNLKTIAADLKTIRQKQQLTQRQLAIRAHVSQTTISRLENNNLPKIHNLITIIHALNYQLTLMRI